MWYTESLRAYRNGRRFVSAPTAHLNRWEVIGMMDQYITLGDLLKIGSFLLDLATLILYIYYNEKNSKKHHHKKK